MINEGDHVTDLLQRPEQVYTGCQNQERFFRLSGWGRLYSVFGHEVQLLFLLRRLSLLVTATFFCLQLSPRIC